MATRTIEYTALNTPTVAITEVDSLVSSAKVWTATVAIAGLSPNRNTTAEERSAGISSLEPPTVTETTPQKLITLAVRATASSYEATEGQEMTPVLYHNITLAVSRGMLGALRVLGVDV